MSRANLLWGNLMKKACALLGLFWHIATKFRALQIFFKIGNSRPLYFLMSSFSHYDFNHTNWKKRRWCTWDFNPGAAWWLAQMIPRSYGGCPVLWRFHFSNPQTSFLLSLRDGVQKQQLDLTLATANFVTGLMKYYKQVLLDFPLSLARCLIWPNTITNACFSSPKLWFANRSDGLLERLWNIWTIIW